MKKTALAALTVTAALALTACGSGSESTTNAASSRSASSPGYTLKVGYIGTTGRLTGPEGFAYSRGQLQKWLGADGIAKLQLSQFANGPLLTAAMTGGALDIGNLGDTPALLAKSHGLPVELINQSGVGLPAWIVAKKGGATSVQGLAGKTIARPQGSYMDRYVQGLLAQNGLTSKVRLSALLTPQAIAALQKGAIDAVTLPAWQAAPATANGARVIAKSEATPDIEGTTVAIATDEVLGAHPDLPEVWNTARQKAIDYAKANEEEFYAFQAEAQGIKGGGAAAKRFLPLSTYPRENYTPKGLTMLKSTLDFLVSVKQAEPFSIDEWKQPGT